MLNDSKKVVDLKKKKDDMEFKSICMLVSTIWHNRTRTGLALKRTSHQAAYWRIQKAQKILYISFIKFRHALVFKTTLQTFFNC